jgi:hypothetical protein
MRDFENDPPTERLAAVEALDDALPHPPRKGEGALALYSKPASKKDRC